MQTIAKEFSNNELVTEETVIYGKNIIENQRNIINIDFNPKKDIMYNVTKRTMDIALSAFALTFLSPVLLITGLIVRIDSKGPAIFKQIRVGKNNKTFTMYKFRSMVKDAEQQLDSLAEDNERDGPVFKIAKDPRTTRVGRFLRKSCIDELPQLVNILLGHMSIVGPRPPLEKEVAEYNSEQMKRLAVKPGLTCYWQVQKGNDTTFDEWVEMDLKYIREKSIKTDIKLIFKTMAVVLFGRGDC